MRMDSSGAPLPPGPIRAAPGSPPRSPVHGRPQRQRAPRPNSWPWLLGAVIVIALDQASKSGVERWFFPGERLVLIPGLLDLTLVYNRGAAFSFLAGAGGWQRWLFTAIGLVAAGFIVHLLRRAGTQRLFPAALMLILGGALGNVIDRIVRGQVVDFIDLYWQQHHWPAFNIADSAITVGAVLLVIDELRRTRRQKHDRITSSGGGPEHPGPT